MLDAFIPTLDSSCDVDLCNVVLAHRALRKYVSIVMAFLISKHCCLQNKLKHILSFRSNNLGIFTIRMSNL